MAKFTRADIRRILGDAHTEDIENQLVALHLGVVDPLKDQIAQYKTEAEKLPAVQKELDELKDKGDDGWKEKHDAVKREFDDYKKEQTAKETHEAKVKAAKAYFAGKNIEGANLNLALRSCANEIDALELDGEAIKDTTALDSLVSGDLSALVSKSAPNVRVDIGGRVGGGATPLTRSDIIAIKDPAERQAKIAENLHLFKKG